MVVEPKTQRVDLASSEQVKWCASGASIWWRSAQRGLSFFYHFFMKMSETCDRNMWYSLIFFDILLFKSLLSRLARIGALSESRQQRWSRHPCHECILVSGLWVESYVFLRLWALDRDFEGSKQSISSFGSVRNCPRSAVIILASTTRRCFEPIYRK